MHNISKKLTLLSRGYPKRTNHEGLERFIFSCAQVQTDFIDGKTGSALPECVRSFAYWNLAYMKSPQLLNAQTGELVKTQLKPMGNDTLIAAGQSVPAQRYRLTGKDIQIDLWYSAQNHWLGLESLQDGRRIRYVLQ